ncbi:MAG: hypothetical protein AB4372_38310 [Xenococcus sp. (in: cyanobacteria)]
MKYHKLLFIGLLISGLSLFVANPVHAEPKVTTIPTNLTVAGKRCLIAKFDCKTTTRYLLLRSNQEVTNLKIIPLDLNRTDGAKVFSADAIKINSSNISSQIQKLPTNAFLKIPIDFNFKDTSSGEFNGSLLVIYQDGELSIPLTVKVKDNFLLPLLLLLVGVGLGLVVSAYRTEGMARDEVLVKVGSLRNKMRADNELDDSFKTTINAHLVEVETVLENKRWQAAEEAVDAAQKVWDKWRKSRTDWIDLLKSESQLYEYLHRENPEDSEQKIPFLQNLRWQLRSIHREIADLESPQKLSESLQEVREQLNRYLQSKNQYENFNYLRNQLSQLENEQDEFWRLEAINLQEQLYNLSPSNKEAFKQWQEEVKNQTEELLTAIQEKSKSESTNQQASNIARSINNPSPNVQIEPIPNAQPLGKDGLDNGARQRLRVFNLVSYGIAIFLLGGVGFTQLYAENKIFGASGLTDYFALLAWGFGAEASRESVTKFLQDWRLLS